MDKPFYRRESDDIQAAVKNFALYHDYIHEAVDTYGKTRRWYSVDRGTFSTPILPEEYLAYLGSERFSKSQHRPGRDSVAYGPEVGPEELRSKIAERENLLHGTSYEAKEIAMMAGAWNGLVHAMEHIMKDRCNESDRDKVLVIGPTLYQMFWKATHFEKMNVVAHDYTVPGAEHIPTKEDIEDMFREKPRIIVITNPNNPDGQYIHNNVLQAIITRAAEEDTYVIIDEIQNCLSADGAQLQYGSWIQAPHVIRVDGPAKRYSLAEYREGWIIADPAILGNRLEGVTGRMSSEMGNAPRAANLALYKLCEHEIAVLRQQVDSIMTPTYEAIANQEQFFLNLAQGMQGITEIIRRDACINFAIRTNYDGTDMQLAEKLVYDHGALIMPASGYGYQPEHAVLRVTFAERKAAVQGALKALDTVLNEAQA